MIDEAGARVRLQGDDQPPDLKEIDEEVETPEQGKGRSGRQSGLRKGRALCAIRPTSSKKKKQNITRDWREKSREADGVVDEEVDRRSRLAR